MTVKFMKIPIISMVLAGFCFILPGCAKYEFPEIDPAQPLGLVIISLWEYYEINTDDIEG